MKTKIQKLPKIDLHRHLEGALRLSTLREVAQTLKLAVPENEEQFREHALVLRPLQDLKAVLDRFELHQTVLHSTEVLERITYEACEDAFLEGIHILELRYAPSFVLMNHSDLNFEFIHSAILGGIKRAEKSFPMAVGLIGILVRTEPIEMAAKVTDFLIEHKDTFMGIDLASDEVGSDCVPFSKFFEKAKKHGLHVTVHAGEANYKNSAKAVKDSIEILGAERIGHGLQIIKDPSVMDLVKRSKAVLELCPLSNELTSTGFSRTNYPILELEKAGVLVTVNSDDPGLFGTSLMSDYECLVQGQRVSIDDFKRWNQNAFSASFIPEKKKMKFQHLFY